VKKLNVGILFGGKSAEHEISLLSARNVYEALDREKYTPVLIGIDKKGCWHLNDESQYLLDAGDPRLIRLNEEGSPVGLLPSCGGTLTSHIRLDVVFPILHGPLGEDGTIQGLLKLAEIPFVGAGVLGSAAGMDKDVMKRLLRDGGVPIGDFICLRSHEAPPGFDELAARLGLPFFVKPANMGSSVGVNKIRGQEEYLPGIADAFKYDSKIVIEEFIPGRELECSVLGNEDPQASVPGEIKSTHEFYSYEAKYIDEHGAVMEIPAKIPEETAERVRELAIRTFKVLECEGLGRVDFFLKDSGEVIVNEINTMPGFTRISMYPKLWEASGVSYTELIDRLILLALTRFGKEKALTTSFSIKSEERKVKSEE
jgi:D-alanine-D-alanine ligase